MKDKNSFVLYLDQQEMFNKLPDAVAGKLIKHIFSYVNDEEPEAEDLLLEVAFSPIKQTLKRDLKKWTSQIKQRSEAGKRSAEKRASKANEKATNPTTVETRSTNPTDSVSVSVSVSDSVSVSNNKKPLSSSTSGEAYEIFSYWRTVMNKGGNTKPTKGRIDKINARLKNYSADEIKLAIDGCAGSAHHMGKNPKTNPECKIYDCLTLICRSDEKLEMFIGYTKATALTHDQQLDREFDDYFANGLAGQQKDQGRIFDHE